MRSHLTFANVLSVTAVFLALSGGAYALTIPANSVGATQLRKNAVRSSDVKDASLLPKDFKPGALPAGAAGRDGAPGKDGAPGATNVVVRTVLACEDLPQNIHCSVVLQCLPGERATGGGAGFVGFGGNEVLMVSHPLEADGTNPENGDIPTGWMAAVKHAGLGARDAVGYTICASL